MKIVGNWIQEVSEDLENRVNYFKRKLIYMESIINSKTSLFFIALIPHKELRDKINKFKLDFSKRFESSKALKVYPHITLKAPFVCSDSSKRELIEWFSERRSRQKSFTIDLKGFGAFSNKEKPVVFVNPVINNELMKMQKELMAGFNAILPAYVHPVDLNFKPHITVAYRDLTPENFSRAWKEYKDKPFNDVFKVEAIYLLEHDRKKWNLIGTHNLR